MRVKVWKNTSTIDSFLDSRIDICDPEVAEYAIVGTRAFDQVHMPNLKAIFRCGVGVDNIDFKKWQSRGVPIHLPSANTKELIYEETANFTVASVLNGLYRWSGSVEDWSKKDRPSLQNRRLLVIGVGNIGKRVIEKMSNLVAVDSWDISSNTDEQLFGLLSLADVVSLHFPLTPENEGWFGERHLSAMKNSSVLVNTARGQLVDEDHLLKEIGSGRLRAVFDVFWEEPYRGPLAAFHPEGFLMTPHIASHSLEFIQNLAADFFDLISDRFPDG